MRYAGAMNDIYKSNIPTLESTVGEFQLMHSAKVFAFITNADSGQ